MKKKIFINIILILFMMITILSFKSFAASLKVGKDTSPNIGQFAAQRYSAILGYTSNDLGKTVSSVSEGKYFWYREYSSRTMCIHEDALNSVSDGNYELQRIIDLAGNTATIYESANKNGRTHTNSIATVFYNAYMAFLGYYRRECRSTQTIFR